jgi:hypothetical protein
MKRHTHLRATVVLAASALVGWAPSASADSGSGRGDDIVRTGNCSGRADWKLKGKARDGGLEVEFEVDSNRVGQRWNFTLRQDGVVRAQGVRTTTAPSGSFSVERRVPNTAGPDRFVATATHRASGQTCRGTLTL